MTRLTWILYLTGAALVFGSWVGLIHPWLGWAGWALATAVALLSWAGRLRQPPAARISTSRPKPPPQFTPEEEEAARREVTGKGPPA